VLSVKRLNWSLDLALVLLVWRLAINPVSSWWRDPPALLILCWIALTLTAKSDKATMRRAGDVALLATMSALLGLFAWRQLPLTLRVLGLQ
jgi:hypothetical protein